MRISDWSSDVCSSDLVGHRAVVAADSSRRLAPRSTGILDGQETLIVPHLSAKLGAQLAGLGVGFLPQYMVQAHLDSGALVKRDIEEPRAPTTLHLAWRAEIGRASCRERVCPYV